MNLLDLARSLKRRLDHHEPLVIVSISRENLLHNLRAYQAQYSKRTFAPVLKSNAYGHGLAVVAKLLDKENIPFFVVDSFYEARTLRRVGINSRILVIGYVRPEEIALNLLSKVDFGIVDIKQLQELARVVRKPRRIHIKIDTGMHRQGITMNDVEETISLCASNQFLNVVGICSHLADADSSDRSKTLTQVKAWNTAVTKFQKIFPDIEYRHLSATAGIDATMLTETNIIRLGIGLYGFDTSLEKALDLKPVLELRSLISSLRDINVGESVGYNATFTATQPMKVATVPTGYFEGVDRQLSNIGIMQVRKKSCRIVGRVSMNMSSIDVTKVPDVAPGNVVTVISREQNDSNSVKHISELCNTIPYVILVHIPQHLKRVVE